FLDVTSADLWRNRAVTDPFEPGSTFKAILAAAALEEGAIRPDDRVYAENGSITVAGTTIRDWKKYGWLTFAEVLQNSSNVGSIKVGLALGRERYHRYMKAFGFGAVTGVGLAGESRGLLRDPQRWSALSLPTMSIGQEISVTALQLVAAFGAIANGGTLMQPRLVRATFDAEGREVAAPIFSAIGREALRYLEIAPHDVPPVQIVTGPATETGAPARVRLVSTAVEIVDADGTRRMPDLTGQTLRQALGVLEPLHV